MLIRRAEEMEGRPVEMEGVRGVSMRLMVGRGDGAPTFAMRLFSVDPGGNTPRHQHNYEHEVYILEGRGTFEHEGSLHEIRAGDALFVEANALHQFVNDSPKPLRFLCLVPVSFDCGREGCKPVPGS